MSERSRFRFLSGMIMGLSLLVACGDGGGASSSGSGGSGASGSGGSDAGAGGSNAGVGGSKAGSGGSGGSGDAGSGGSGGGNVAYVCDNRFIESRCFNYWSDATKSDVEGSCDGNVTEGPCPLQNSVGMCAITAENGPNAGKVFTAVYYSDGPMPWTEMTAKTSCMNTNGMWVLP